VWHGVGMKIEAQGKKEDGSKKQKAVKLTEI